MMRELGLRSLLFAGAMICASCFAGSFATNPVEVVPREGAPWYLSTDPAAVAIIRYEPQRPYQVLGDVVIDRKSNLSEKDVERKLRAAVANIGADAVVILPSQSDQVRPTGIPRAADAFIYAIAIRYVDRTPERDMRP